MKRRLIGTFLKLARIQQAIEAEHKRPAPNWMRLFRLKRLRLVTQDRMARLFAPRVQAVPVPVRIRARRH